MGYPLVVQNFCLQQVPPVPDEPCRLSSRPSIDRSMERSQRHLDQLGCFRPDMLGGSHSSRLLGMWVAKSHASNKHLFLSNWGSCPTGSFGDVSGTSGAEFWLLEIPRASNESGCLPPPNFVFAWCFVLYTCRSGIL